MVTLVPRPEQVTGFSTAIPGISVSMLEMRINGTQPLLLGSNLRDDNAILTVDLTNADIFSSDRVIVLEKDDVMHIRLTIASGVRLAQHRLPAAGAALTL